MSQKPLAIVILAAGMGTRMKSDLPKVMHPLAGLPMVHWLLQTAEDLKPEKVIVVCGPDMPDLVKTVKPHKTVIQKERKGTADAVRAALPALKDFDGDVLILLGDAPLITGETLENLIETKRADLLTGLSVLGVEMQDPEGYGRLVQKKDGTVTKIIEEKDASAKEKEIRIVNVGAFCVDGAKLPGWIESIENNNAQKEFYLTDLPEIAAKDGTVTQAYVTTDVLEIQGCNSRSDLAALEETLQNRMRKIVLDRGTTLIDPKTVYFHYDTFIAPDVVIEPHVYFGPGVHVSEGVRIKGFSHIEGAKIAKSATIGPFARLRPGTEIGEEARIGNFVEVKKSQIGARSKINHLAYVGDTHMGEDVNFSAGAITVNYDGFEKHQTTIGKGVMVGSNVNLIAPVIIDDGAFIAAGSTINEDLPADSLSVARDRVSIREGWAAEYRKRKQALAKKIAKKKKTG